MVTITNLKHYPYMKNLRNKTAKTEAASKQKKMHVVSTRLDDGQYQTAMDKCRKSGRKLSEFWRRALLDTEVKAVASPEDMAILRQIASESNNLNQLAKRANEAGFKLVKWEVEDLAAKIKSLYHKLSHDWKN